MTESTKPPAPIPSNLPMQWTVLGAFLLIAVPAVPLTLWLGRNVSPAVMQICRVALAGVLTLVLSRGSKATAEGKLWGIKFNATGHLASFVILYALFGWVIPNFGSHTVRLFLENGGKVLDMPFRAMIHMQGAEPFDKQGERGQVLFQVPGDVDKIKDVNVTVAGYEVVSSGPYSIKDGAITVKMRPSMPPPPATPEDFPSQEAITDMPIEDAVSIPPQVRPTDVTLQYKNLTQSNLRLVFLSCTTYYESRKPGAGKRSPWTDFPFPARNEFKSFDKFTDKSSGWYCFFVTRLDPESGTRKHFYLGSWNLFQSKTPVLIVTDSNGKNKPFVAEFRTSE